MTISTPIVIWRPGFLRRSRKDPSGRSPQQLACVYTLILAGTVSAKVPSRTRAMAAGAARRACLNRREAGTHPEPGVEAHSIDQSSPYRAIPSLWATRNEAGFSQDVL